MARNDYKGIPEKNLPTLKLDCPHCGKTLVGMPAFTRHVRKHNPRRKTLYTETPEQQDEREQREETERMDRLDRLRRVSED